MKERDPPKTAQNLWKCNVLGMFCKVTRWIAKTPFKAQLHFVTKMSLQGRRDISDLWVKSASLLAIFGFKNVKFRLKKTLSLSHRFCVSVAEPSSEDFTVISHFLSNPANFFFALPSWLSLSSVILQLSPPIPLARIVLPVSVPISHCMTLSSSAPAQPCSVFHTWTMQTLNQGWACCHSHPDPWPQHGRIKHPPHVWFLTGQKGLTCHFMGSLLNAKSQEVWD